MNTLSPLCTIVLVASCGARLETAENASAADGGASTSGGDNTTVTDGGTSRDDAGSADASTPTQPLTTCCHQRAHCVPTASIPADDQSSFDTDSCTDTELCVPDQLLDHDPLVPCTATSYLLGDYTGTCLSDCLHFGIESLLIVPGSCGAHLECVP
jgi:hypothetical protein